MSGQLDHSPAEITLELLIDAGLGFRVNAATPVDWMVFLNKEVDRKLLSNSNFEVENIISVFDTVGIVRDRIQIDGSYQEMHGIQILIRLNEYSEYVGQSKAREILNYLDTSVNRYRVNVNNVVSTDYIVHSYHRTSDIIRMNSTMKDDTLHGLRFSLNLLMFVTKE